MWRITWQTENIKNKAAEITFTVAECGEFHSMGEYREGIESMEEAEKFVEEAKRA